MAENHGAQKAGQLPKTWTIGRILKRSRRRASGAESVAGQNRRTRSLIRMTASAK